MELVELPSRAGLDKDGDDEVNEAQLATGAKKKSDIQKYCACILVRPNPSP